MKAKKIYLLLGAKGSGKSTIGTLLEERFDLKFLRVENWAKEIKGSRSIENESYVQEVFQTIETGVREELEGRDEVVFESTGLTKYFDQMLESLKDDFRVITIEVWADQDRCLERVRSRNQKIHINVSDEQVIRLNQQVQAKNISCDFRIDNNTDHIKDLEVVLERMIQAESD